MLKRRLYSSSKIVLYIYLINGGQEVPQLGERVANVMNVGKAQEYDLRLLVVFWRITVMENRLGYFLITVAFKSAPFRSVCPSSSVGASVENNHVPGIFGAVWKLAYFII